MDMRVKCATIFIIVWIIQSSATIDEQKHRRISSVPSSGRRIERNANINCEKNNGGCDQHCGTTIQEHRTEDYCYCSATYTLLDDLTSCSEDLKSTDCLRLGNCNVICIEGSCTCPNGTRPNGHKCIDIDECRTASHGCQEGCINTYGSYYCYCPAQGMRLQFNGKTCEDINECIEDSNICDHTCENTLGSFRCSCREGYQLHSRIYCKDIDECAVHNGGCSHRCHNFIGQGFNCSCPMNLVLHKNGKTCVEKSDAMKQCYNPRVTKNQKMICSIKDICSSQGRCYKEKICTVKCLRSIKAEKKLSNTYRCGAKTGYKWTVDASKHTLICTKKNSNPSYEIYLKFAMKTKKCNGFNSQVHKTRKRLTRLFQGSNKDHRYQVRKLQLKCISTHSNLYVSLFEKRKKIITIKLVLILRSFKLTKKCRKFCIRKFTKSTLNKRMTEFHEQLKNDIVFRIHKRKTFIIKRSLKRGKIKRICRKGHVLFNSLCLACQPGSFLKNGRCSPCPFGTYQDSRGQSSCKTCGSTYLGRKTEWGDAIPIGFVSFSSCRDYCEKGTHSINGLKPCKACLLGTYQPNTLSTRCLLCPKAYSFTKRTGSISHLHCLDSSDNNVEECAIGSYFNEFRCQKCPKNRYQLAKGQNFCHHCPKDTFTDNDGAKSHSQCKDRKCIMLRDSEQGEIRSPNWPSYFPRKSSCNLKIKTKAERLILLFFNKISLPEQKCSDFKLTIKYPKKKMITICGNQTRPMVLNLNTTRVHIDFHSGMATNNRMGFSLFYVSYSKIYHSLIDSIVKDDKLYTLHKSILQDRNLLNALISLIRNPSTYYMVEKDGKSRKRFPESFLRFITEKVNKFFDYNASSSPSSSLSSNSYHYRII